MARSIQIDSRFLLYIDILGFAELTRSQPKTIQRIYAILDSLNVHTHGTFRTVVFSDTVLVYNPILAATDEEREYLVWYLIEFAEDLHHRLTGQSVYFRAVITAGAFSHYRLKNVECYFGEALVNAYYVEKQIPSIGLFIHKRCNKYNKYFRVATFDDNYHFVYLNRSLEYLDKYTGGTYPMLDPSLEDQAPHVPWQVRFLEDVYRAMRTHPNPRVRTKFLTAWDYYAKRYPGMIQALTQHSFSLMALAGRQAWVDEMKRMKADINHFKKIGRIPRVP